MMRQDTLRNTSSGFSLRWRLLSTFVAGLLFGLLGYLLLKEFGGNSAMFVPATPLLLLLGVLGRLAAARTKRPLWSGFGLGGLAWFGILLGFGLGLMLDPTAVQGCFAAGCDPGVANPRESIWADKLAAFLALVFLTFLLVVGQLLVLAGVAVTHGVLKLIANTPASSR